MQIHCLIRRVGPTTVSLENTKYIFMPITGTKYHKEKRYDFVKNAQGKLEKVWKDVSVPEESTSVCDIQKQEHVDHLLQLVGSYEEYDQEKVEREQKEERLKKNPLSGFGVEKHSDAGYVATHKKGKEIFYAGEDQQWVPKGTKLTPFKSEMEAFSFIKEESESLDPEEDLDKTLEKLEKAGKSKKA